MSINNFLGKLMFISFLYDLKEVDYTSDFCDFFKLYA